MSTQTNMEGTELWRKCLIRGLCVILSIQVSQKSASMEKKPVRNGSDSLYRAKFPLGLQLWLMAQSVCGCPHYSYIQDVGRQICVCVCRERKKICVCVEREREREMLTFGWYSETIIMGIFWVTAPTNWTTFGCRTFSNKVSSYLKAFLFEKAYKNKI